MFSNCLFRFHTYCFLNFIFVSPYSFSACHYYNFNLAISGEANKANKKPSGAIKNRFKTCLIFESLIEPMM